MRYILFLHFAFKNIIKISFYLLRHPLRGIEMCSYCALYLHTRCLDGLFGTAVVQLQILILSSVSPITRMAVICDFVFESRRSLNSLQIKLLESFL